MHITEPVLIFSAWRVELNTQENRRNVSALKLMLKDENVRYAVAQGSYKGQIEPALVVIDTAPARRTVQRLCRHLNQESILAVDENRAARLENCHGHLIENLGTLRGVPENVARACDAWTRIGSEFYTTKSL